MVPTSPLPGRLFYSPHFAQAERPDDVYQVRGGEAFLDREGRTSS
jgi:hypothetical protein